MNVLSDVVMADAAANASGEGHFGGAKAGDAAGAGKKYWVSPRCEAMVWCAVGNAFSLSKDGEAAIKFFKRAISACSDFPY